MRMTFKVFDGVYTSMSMDEVAQMIVNCVIAGIFCFTGAWLYFSGNYKYIILAFKIVVGLILLLLAISGIYFFTISKKKKEILLCVTTVTIFAAIVTFFINLL